MLDLHFKKDYIIFFPAIFLSIFGLSTIFSINTSNLLFEKQLILTIFGIILALIISRLDLEFLKKGQFIFMFFGLSFFLLGLLVFLGQVTNGAQSWFRIGGISFQPVEMAKLSLILLLAKFFYKRHIEVSYLPTFLLSTFYPLIIFLLTILQPDLGSAVVVMGIWFFIILVSGISKKYIIGILSLIVFLFSIGWFFLFANYQKERILTFINPGRDIQGSGYNVYQSMIAVGSGGLYGKGINFGTQSKLSYLPEYETDFIFAAFSEEWGFFGSLFCLLLFLFLILRILTLAKSAKSNFETIFFVGVSAYFIIHTGINIGMNIGLIPVTGLPLPFMSGGGTHVIFEWIMIGMVVSFSNNKKRIEKEVYKREFFA